MKVESELQGAPSILAPGASTVGSWELVVGDGRLNCSLDAGRIFGLEAAAPLDALCALALPEDAPRLRAAFDRALDTGAPLDLECWIAHADGAERHLHLRAEHVAGESGRPARLWGTVHDVTDRRRLSSALRESAVARADAAEAREQAARILESVSDAFVALDREWRYTHVNAKAASVFGRTPEDMIGTHIWTEFPEGVGQSFYHAYHRAMEQREFVFLEEHYAPYDRWFENRIYPTADGIAIFFHDITDRHRAAEILAESEERFRQLADNVQEVFWLWSVEQDEFIYVSPAFETIWHRRCDEVYASPRVWSSFIHPDDRAAIVSALPRRVTGQYDEEYRIVRPDGSVRWIADRGFPIRDAQGRVHRIAGVAQDITDRHDAQQAIQRIATGLTTTLESITDAFYTLDGEWRFTYVNHEAERLMRRTRGELLGKSVWDAFPEAVDTTFHRQFHRAVRENVAVRFDDFYPPLAGWFEVRAFPSAQGLAVYFLDVTERRRVLEELQRRGDALRQRTQQLDMALEVARLGVWSWDLDTNLVATIQGDGPACGLVEGTYPSTGDAFKELVHADDRAWVMERLKTAADTGTDYRAEFRIRSADGDERWISSQGHWMRDADGRHVVMIGADLDITERRQAANDLRAFALRLESAQDAERSAIAREVHDELGQALTVLRMDSTRLAKLTASSPELTDLVREMTEVIDSTLQRTRSIAIALHPSALDDLGLAAAIEIHVNHVARRTTIEMSLDLQPVSARVDRARARAAYRVLQESLTNVVRHAGATHLTVRLAEHTSELVLQVQDDGCGIKPEQLTGGGSLGLLGMRERAAAFGGRVSFAAVEPSGTRVTLHLPLEP